MSKYGSREANTAKLEIKLYMLCCFLQEPSVGVSRTFLFWEWSFLGQTLQQNRNFHSCCEGCGSLPISFWLILLLEWLYLEINVPQLFPSTWGMKDIMRDGLPQSFQWLKIEWQKPKLSLALWHFATLCSGKVKWFYNISEERMRLHSLCPFSYTVT